MRRLGAKHGRNSSVQDYADVLENRENFKTGGALRGSKGAPLSYDLPMQLKNNGWHDFANLIAVSGAEIYTVWSYAAPIAFCVMMEHGPVWYVPPVKYSRTTTAHQNKIRAALERFTLYRIVPTLWSKEQFLIPAERPSCACCRDNREARARVLMCFISVDGERYESERDFCDTCVVNKREEFKDPDAWKDIKAQRPYFSIVKEY